MPARPHTKWGFAALFGIAGAVLVGIVVLAFVWPIATASARDLPVAIAGPDAQVNAIESAVASGSDGAIAFTPVADRDAAVASIERRETYGAIVLGPAPEVLVASAANASVASLLRSTATELQAGLQAQAPGAVVTVTDVVPLSASDPNGSGLVAASFPLVLGGMLGGILISFLVVGVLRRFVALGICSLAAGVLLALVMQTWFGFLQGDFALNALALALSMLGTASFIVGLHALLGTRGIPVAAVITMLVGNPISGASLPHEFIASPWGTIGQYFVPGAASSLVRELSYFPQANPTMQWLVLGAWSAAGLILSAAGHFRSRAPIALPAVELSEGAHAA